MPAYLVRHQSTRLNAGDPADPRDYFRGWIDEPLSETGRSQAETTARWFTGRNVEAVLTSDLARARESAEPIARHTGAPVLVDARLRPWDIGHLSGQPITQERLGLLQRLQNHEPEEPVPGGESFRDFLERYRPALHDLVRAGKGHSVVAVTHHRNLLSLNKAMNEGAAVPLNGPPPPGGIIQLGERGGRIVFVPPQANAPLRKAAS